MKEVWKPVPGWRGYYEASNFGRIKSLERVVPHAKSGSLTVREKILKTPPDNHGYPQVNLVKNGTNYHRKLHILIARMFLGPRPKGLDVCHRNGIKKNCRASNLRYGSRSSNQNDRVIHGTSNRGERCGSARLTRRQVRAIRSEYARGGISYQKIAVSYGLHRGTVSDIVRRTKWRWLR